MAVVVGSDQTGAAGDSAVWRRVMPFVALTFVLSWLLALAILLAGGYGQQQTLVALQLQMLIPAACAILLGIVSVRYGSSRVRESAGRARLFFYFFLAFTLAYIGIAAAALAIPDLALTATGISSVLALLSVVALLVLRFARGRESFTRAGLTFGRPVHWLVYGAGIVALYLATTGLNYAFGLGSSPDLTPYLRQSQMPIEAFLIASAVQSVLVNSFLGIVIAFGEEYGWRGFLQGELIKLGRVRGILAVGLIWGAWHAPIIAMGHNYPGYPVGGIFLMIAYSTLLAFILGYAVLKTGSIWLAAFLHALNNQVVSYLVVIVYTPRDPVFQFDAGIYGIAVLAVVVLLLLRDPIWKQRD